MCIPFHSIHILCLSRSVASAFNFSLFPSLSLPSPALSPSHPSTHPPTYVYMYTLHAHSVLRRGQGTTHAPRSIQSAAVTGSLPIRDAQLRRLHFARTSRAEPSRASRSAHFNSFSRSELPERARARRGRLCSCALCGRRGLHASHHSTCHFAPHHILVSRLSRRAESSRGYTR